MLQSARSVWRQSYNKKIIVVSPTCCNLHGACGGKVLVIIGVGAWGVLQSARSVWRQSAINGTSEYPTELQSARSVWRQRGAPKYNRGRAEVAICTERVEAKISFLTSFSVKPTLQSARSVWRQRPLIDSDLFNSTVAICTERVEAKGSICIYNIYILRLQSARSVWRQRLSVVVLMLGRMCCNLHGACGGKEIDVL